MEESKGNIKKADGNDSGNETKAEVGRFNGSDSTAQTVNKQDKGDSILETDIEQEQGLESESSVSSQVSKTMMVTLDEERKNKMEILLSKAKLNKKARRKRAKQQKKEELARQKEKEAEETQAKEEKERLTKLRDEERAVTRKRHKDLHYRVQQLQAQLDGLMAEDAAVAEDLLDQGEMLEARTIQGPALVDTRDE